MIERVAQAINPMIKGEKIRLRPATLDDRRRIFEWLAESDITARMIGPPDFADNPAPTWEEFVADYTPQYFDALNPDQGRSFIIETALQGEPIGQINYGEINRRTATVELDIWLANSRVCHQGFGTDAINTLCQYLTETLACKAFILAPSARNKAAIRAYEKCGFHPTNEVPENFIPDYFDTVVMVRKEDQ